VNALEIIAERLAGIEAAVASGAPLLMTRRAYAQRVAYSARFLDGALPAEAWAGSGRARRVIVAKADAYLLARREGDDEPEESGDDVERLALRAARGSR
jgi:hypothetical protein